MTSVSSLPDSWLGGELPRLAAPVREQVIEALTAAILGGRLVAGQRLVERELMETLRVSRATIREALRELASQGLIRIIPRRGAIVSAPTYEEARDMYEVRAALESLIVERFVESASDEQIDALGTAVQHFADQVAEHGDVVDALRAKDEFYSVLLDGAGSAVFRELVEQLQTRVHVLRATSLSAPGRAAQTVEELNGIVAAARRRDALSASALCSAHIRAAAHTALANLAPSVD